jgi:hypothetical protein
MAGLPRHAVLPNHEVFARVTNAAFTRAARHRWQHYNLSGTYRQAETLFFIQF